MARIAIAVGTYKAAVALLAVAAALAAFAIFTATQTSPAVAGGIADSAVDLHVILVVLVV